MGALVAVVLVGACRPDRTPVGPPVQGATLEQVPVRGHLVRVERGAGLPPVQGELIAAGPEGLWVWTGPDALLGATGSHRRIAELAHDVPAEHVRIPPEAIRRVVVSRYHPGKALAATGGWTGGLMLLTLSHGFLFIFTMPAVAVAGAGAMVATHVQSRVYVHRGSGERRAALPERLSALRGFARFPQGVPPQWPPAGLGEDEPAAADAPASEETTTTPAETGETETGETDTSETESSETDSTTTGEAEPSEPATVPEPPAP